MSKGKSEDCLTRRGFIAVCGALAAGAVHGAKDGPHVAPVNAPGT